MTISQENLDRLRRFWEKNEDALSTNNVNSLSDLVAYLLDQIDGQKVEPRLEHINVFEDHITIRDNKLKREVDVYVKNENELWCSYDDSFDCIHVGYAWAIPKVIKALKPKNF